MTDIAKDRTGDRVAVETNPNRRQPQVTLRTQAAIEDPVSVVGRLVTLGRLAWIAIVIAAGGIGTGVGFLMGEGAARATFAAQYEAHEKRIAATEKLLDLERSERLVRDERERTERAREADADRVERAKLIEKIGLVAERMSGVEGSLAAIKDQLRQGRRP